MAIYFGGRAYSKAYAGGAEVSQLLAGGASYHAARTPDRPGTLAVSVSLSGRNYEFTFSVTDPDGIRSITAATVTASDGTVANVLGDFARSDANTYAGTDSRRNARWASGTMSVTYTDATSGESRTLTQNWSV